MNHIILEDSEFRGGSLYRLKERKSNHILKILKSKVGDRLKAGLLNRSTGFAIVSSIDRNKREVEINYEVQNFNLPLAILGNVKLFSAIQRPQTVKKIIQLAANCGVKELLFFPAMKSESTYLNSSLWEKESLLDEIILGLEQGGRVEQPRITILKNKFRIKEHLTPNNRFILNLDGKKLSEVKIHFDSHTPIQIVIGPESGFELDDLKFFLNLDFETISISESVLRSEIAFAFVLSQLELLKSSST